MRYGNDYGMDRGWNRGTGDRGDFGGRGPGSYARRDFMTNRGEFSGGAGGYDHGYRGREMGGVDRDRMERERGRGGGDREWADRERERGGHRYFGYWANDDDDNWESTRRWPLGYGRPPARMMNRGRGYGGDYDAGRGRPGGRGGYDRGW